MTARRFVRRAAIGVAGSLVAVFSVPAMPARADTISDKRAQAVAIAARIDALGVQEAALSEQYDAAVLAEQQTSANLASAKQALQHDGELLDSSRSALRAAIIDAYVGGSSVASRSGGSAPARSAQEQVLRAEYQSILAARQQDTLDRYRMAQVQEATAESQLAQSEAQLKAKVAVVSGARTSVVATQAQLQDTYQQVQGQLAVLVAQAQAQRQAEQARQAQARLAAQQAAQAAAARPTTSATASGASASVDVPSPPASTSPGAAAPRSSEPAAPVPTGSGGQVAVQAALSRLGDPYVWGAAGPNSFDCSGLTMWAWAHAGVQLPHYSGAQYDSTTHIPMSELQPGDLVFFADPGEHEAMYIGNGQIVEAPHTGADVRIMPLYSQFVLASRP